MTEAQKRNLDYLAAKYAQELVQRTTKQIPGDDLSTKQDAKDVDNFVTKALGVLQENGIYAATLYLYSRTREMEHDMSRPIMAEMLGLLHQVDGERWAKPSDIEDANKVLEHVSEAVGGDLESLILAKEVLEQMLIYARYGAKAQKKESGE
jgi:hypothetical protein